MPFYSIFEQRSTYWIIQASDPLDLAFPTKSPLATWLILSPLVRLPAGLTGVSDVLPLGCGRCLVSTSRIDFRAPSADLTEDNVALTTGLRWLRYISGQTGLGRRIVAHNSYPDNVDQSVDAAPFYNPAVGGLMSHVRAGALTFTAIKTALQDDPGMTVPVYAEILLDAIEADAMGDHRKAILYSAIAVESMAATRIDEMHKLAWRDSDAGLRRVAIQTGSGDPVEKDPVFDRLQRDSERNFKLLLHELPLYVIRRSLLLEDNSLHRDLMTLRSTRNDLVHSGTVEPSARLPIDYHGAKKALDSAIRAYAWFSASGRYVTIRSTFRG